MTDKGPIRSGELASGTAAAGGTAGLASGRKTRQHERKRVEFPVTIVDAENRTSGGLSFDASDLSMGGVFLRSSVLFELDEELGIEFLLGGVVVKARARVVRISTDERAGMGIAFSRIDPAHREALQAFLVASA